MPIQKMSPLIILPLLFSFLCRVCLASDLGQGKPAPSIEAKLLDGTSFALPSQLGKVVIVNFWATWCVPCREEMPLLDAYYRQHRAEGLEILAISVDDASDEKAVRSVMSAYSFPAAMLQSVKVGGYGRIRRIPLTFVIDRQGILRRDGQETEGIIDAPTLEKILPLLH